MNILIRPHNKKRFAHLLEQSFRLRHRVFVEMLRWNGMKVVDGCKEIDDFDHDQAMYVLGIDKRDRVISTVRVTPSTAPNVTCEILAPQMGWTPPRGDKLPELARMCVDPLLKSDERKTAFLDLQVSLKQLWDKEGFKGSIGVATLIDITSRIRRGEVIEICTKPFQFPGDTELCVGAYSDEDPNGVYSRTWEYLPSGEFGLVDLDEHAEIAERLYATWAA